MPPKHEFPPFLKGVVPPAKYELWLGRKATAHAKRDRDRNYPKARRASYKEAIHSAVCKSEGRDAYTGELLDWKLIGTYDNKKSHKKAKGGGHAYKAKFAMLPTVDHIVAGAMEASFVICGWRINDAKHDVTLAGFLCLCERVLRHAGYAVNKLGRL